MAVCDVAIERVLNHQLMQLYNYWLSISDGGSLLPPKSSFDPVDLPKLLSSLIMVEMRQEGDGEPRVFYRLVGSNMVRNWGADNSGKYLDELTDGKFTGYLNSQYQQVAQLKRPLYWHYLLRWEDGHLSNNSRLYIPFSSEADPNRVSTIIVGQIIRHDTKILMEPMSPHVKDLEVIELDFQEF
ncbi:PAS domain-containing protein [Curvivirga sp.]|uniref:PAS domain-containing protein n=1 Tax=Curvivirga sp. TaxID=2856848 RepID=UPI003B5A44B4